MAAVVAFIHGAAGAYGVSFPDFPGCIAGGASLEDALRSGREALAFHIEGMLEDGQPLPQTLLTPDDILADPEFAFEVSEPHLLSAIEIDLPGKSQRVNITIDERLLSRIDQAAKTRGMTRSAYLAEAARQQMMKAV